MYKYAHLSGTDNYRNTINGSCTIFTTLYATILAMRSLHSCSESKNNSNTEGFGVICPPASVLLTSIDYRLSIGRNDLFDIYSLF